MNQHFKYLCLGFGLVCCASNLEASPLISVNANETDRITIKVSPRNGSAIGLLEIMVFSPSGDKTGQTIGGYEDDPKSARNTVWFSWIALGPGKRIYLFFGDVIRVYDRTKNAFDGILYSGTSAYAKQVGGNIGGNQIASDRQGAVYIASDTHQLEKLRDDGKAIKPCYSFRSTDIMYTPMGPSASGGLIWVAAHGPSSPFWDSGGSGEVVLFWDSGAELVLVGQYGKPGKASDKPEFINPCATAQTPDHLELWVAEDGLANAEGPPGNARVRKFRITAASSEEVPLELK